MDIKIQKQNDIKDCGISVIQAFHHYFYLEWIDENNLKMQVNYGNKGINVLELENLGFKNGLKIESYNVNFDDLKKSTIKVPFICTIENEGENHYVIAKFKNKKIIVYDSIKGKNIYTFDEFKKLFNGVVLMVEKIKNYYYEPKKINSLYKYLFDNNKILIWIISSTLISVIFTFTSTLFLKTIVDKVIPSHLENTLNLLTIGFGGLIILRIVNMFLKQFLIKKLTIIIEQNIMKDYQQKLLLSSIKDLNKITTNDHLRRFGLINQSANFLAQLPNVLFSQIPIFIISIGLLIWISPSLFGIALISGLFVNFLVILCQMFLREKFDQLINYQMDFYNSSIDLINMNFQVKELNASKNISKKIENKFCDYKNTEYSIWKVSSLENIFSHFITLFIPMLLTYLSTKMIFNNSMSVGVMIMIVNIFQHFISPITEFSGFIINLPHNNKNFKLLSFVLNIPIEKLNLKGLNDDIKSMELQNIKFGYDKNILDIESLYIDKSIKIVGHNGSGKSTLAKVISTRLQINEGKQLVNGIEIEYYNLENIRSKIAYIGQDNYFPNVTILEYISQGNSHAINLFYENIKKYNLHTLFKKMNLNLSMLLHNNGQNLSNGQRQFISLMTLFAHKYDVVILDESFENIDANKTKLLISLIKKVHQKIFIEISHSKNYVSNGKEIYLGKSK